MHILKNELFLFSFADDKQSEAKTDNIDKAVPGTKYFHSKKRSTISYTV